MMPSEAISYKEVQDKRNSNTTLKLTLLFIKCFHMSFEQEKGKGTITAHIIKEKFLF
jgi:hypothetical protein